MTKRDIELALIQMGQAIKTIVGNYSPNANHIGISIVNGTIDVSACQWDGENETYIEKDILNAVLFSDGTMKIDGAYSYPAERESGAA